MTTARQRLAEAKAERLQHANDLIKLIAAEGRRFFYCQTTDRTAHLLLRHGHVYFVDDYSGKEIYCSSPGFGNKWRGFSHGGTLRDLVEDMRDYVLRGTPIPRWKIVIRQLGQPGLEDNVWGYDVDSARRLRHAAYQLPIIAQE